MTIGSWSGTGYMVIDPETGAGAYMISGGLCGGSTVEAIYSMFLVSQLYFSVTLESQVQGIVSMAEILSYAVLFDGMLATAVAYGGMNQAIMKLMGYNWIDMFKDGFLGILDGYSKIGS